MNSAFNTTLRASTTLRTDLTTLSSLPPTTAPPPSLLGQIASSLSTFSRLIDDYSERARHELDSTKAAKAQERLKNFRAELAAYKEEFGSLKKEREATVLEGNRNELLGRRGFGGGTPENPYAGAGAAAASGTGRSVTSSAGTAAANSPWAPRPNSSGGAGGGLSGGGGGLSMGSNDATRETHALREQSFFQNTHSALDDYLARGQAVLGDLGQQREMLKGTQRRLYSVANTLGVSGETIRMVERRARQDRWIFYVGAVVFFAFCWVVLRYLR